MSYQVIARKWRPQSFEDVTGQEHITRTLRNALEFERLHHAYLFSGARGVGKTTTARLLAKAVNCRKTAGPNQNPCRSDDPDICPSCLEISESRSMDVLEIDAASHTGIGDVRETIIEGINFIPARDRYRVFIIDEVHQLSKPAFNALLKTLEEPPKNVMFIMATTELHKVLDTIRSRCQEFEFRTIPIQKIFDRLKLIAGAESIEITDEALREIARSGDGSMRDAQSNFDQVISFSGKSISTGDVTEALGLAGIDVLTRTVHAIAKRESKEVLAVIDDLNARGHDFRNFCRDLLGLFRDLLVVKVAGDNESLFESALLSVEDLRSLGAEFTEGDLIRFFNSLSETESKLREASHSRFVLEIGLIRLVEMRKVAAMEAIIERLDLIEQRFSSGGAIDPSHSVQERTPPAVSEKKTLKIDMPPAVSSPLLVEESETPASIDLSHSETRNPVIKPAEKPPIPYSFATVRLPPLSADELQHFDDTKLDDAFEAALQSSGDTLALLPNAAEVVRNLLGEDVENSYAAMYSSKNGHAAAAAPARDLPSIHPVEKQENLELPELGENPSQELLFQYASAHPIVRMAARVFRAKIVSVSSEVPKSDRPLGT